MVYRAEGTGGRLAVANELAVGRNTSGKQLSILLSHHRILAPHQIHWTKTEKEPGSHAVPHAAREPALILAFPCVVVEPD